ncbi:helix-turn-helix domain-containing protein [Olivibacter jilunii]|uniref:helix-turn-helix domain-containing protein n=1 Tax=Olivibacter jilunii TaxID=985016 RepID=UPI0010326B04|nr:helix-turn-helix transcriptional regulator [Olivibacter jilunii]
MSQKKQETEPVNDPFFKEVGERLKALRIKAGYSNYEKFAIEHDIARSQYLRYEKGENFNMKTFVKILRALKVQPRDFFADIDI